MNKTQRQFGCFWWLCGFAAWQSAHSLWFRISPSGNRHPFTPSAHLWRCHIPSTQSRRNAFTWMAIIYFKKNIERRMENVVDFSIHHVPHPSIPMNLCTFAGTQNASLSNVICWVGRVPPAKHTKHTEFNSHKYCAIHSSACCPSVSISSYLRSHRIRIYILFFSRSGRR